MLENIVPLTRKPDILDCLANLSSDEVFTPPDIANKVLDMLPQEVWSNPKLKFLDPCAKSGVFLREIAKRLMTGLEAVIPDEEQRRDHVFKNMVYGIAITELTALISRRSLYYSKDATNDHSVVEMDDVDGNIYFKRTEHTYKNKKCIHCGVDAGSLDRGDERENYAYAFIHRPLKEVFNMKFDVIIGNPPYQLETSGFGAQARPIYHLFVQLAKELDPTYMSFIIPARWFAGGMGLDEFRDKMINDRQIKYLVDYPKLFDAFPGVEIKGGVCFFVRDKNHHGDCEFKTVISGETVSTQLRDLREGDGVIIRDNNSIKILEKVRALGENNLSKFVSTINPFDLATNFEDYRNNRHDGDIMLFIRGDVKWVPRQKILKNKKWIDMHKVITPKAGDGHGRVPMKVTGEPIYAEAPSACTMTYIVAGAFDNKDEALHYQSYLKTKFVRFLISLRKTAQNVSPDGFKFVPHLDFTQSWDDERLYQKYGLSDEEKRYIDEVVLEMV